MKFRSRRDTLLTVAGAALIAFLAGAAIVAYLEVPDTISAPEIFDAYFPIALIVLVTGVFLSMFFFTNYELTNGYLKYRCGIIYGKIKISRIREIVVGKTMHVGLKPATATKGLIIKYDKYEDIYISPDSNKSFVDAILKIKPDIVVTEVR